MIRRLLLPSLFVLARAASAQDGEIECLHRSHLEIRYELTLEAIDGAPPTAGHVIFAHDVPGTSIERIETGLQPAEDAVGGKVSAVRVSIAASDLAKIRALEPSARQFATNQLGRAPRNLSWSAWGRLRSWGKVTDLNRLRLVGSEDGSALVQTVRAGDIDAWVRAQLLCRGEEVPAPVRESVDRLLSKSDSFDITSDLHVLMTFERPEQGLTVYDSDGSMHTDHYFRKLGITWSTSVDPTGKVRSQFDWSL